MQGDTQTVKPEPNFGLKYVPTYSPTMYATQEQFYDFDDIHFFFF